MRITVPVGTRPEIVKLAHVVTALRGAGHAVRCVATGQHSDRKLAGDFFDALGCAPDVVWRLPDGEGARVGALLANAYTELATYPADAVLVLGDTYTAPLFALAARRFGIGVVHLEAGLRSFNERSVEEVNRKMLAAMATVHLAPTDLAAAFLTDEGVPEERIRVVGNPVIDALAATGVARVPVGQRRGVLLTAHRATNVDDPVRLRELVRLVRRLGEEVAPVTFPMHPRTRDRLTKAGLLDDVVSAPGVDVIEPLPYLDLLRALSSCLVAVTDSGGLQEEASWLGIPAVVLRATTPRWEGVVSGAAVLCGLDAGRVMERVRALRDPVELERVAALDCPYGDGTTAARVVAVFADPGVLAMLTPLEPVADGPLPAAVSVHLAVRA